MDTWHKIKLQLKSNLDSNWIFCSALAIYIYIYESPMMSTCLLLLFQMCLPPVSFINEFLLLLPNKNDLPFTVQVINGTCEGQMYAV